MNFFPGVREKAAKGDADAKAAFDDASRAIYRYSKWPTQAITYLLGKTAIQELAASAKQKARARFEARAFREAFLRMGPVPPSWSSEFLLASLR